MSVDSKSFTVIPVVAGDKGPKGGVNSLTLGACSLMRPPSDNRISVRNVFSFLELLRTGYRFYLNRSRPHHSAVRVSAVSLSLT